MRIACVLRSGGDYLPEHVLRLRDQVAAYHRDAEFFCLSDVEIEGVTTIPLAFDWPGWWAKMELFRPDLDGDYIYLDLDTSIVGPLVDFWAFGGLAIMRDVYRKDGLQSSVMYLSAADRAAVWLIWMADTTHWMRRFHRGGDQAFLERCWLPEIHRWQDVLPGQLVSYKAHVNGRGLPDMARLVVFHGRPRPWDAGW